LRAGEEAPTLGGRPGVLVLPRGGVDSAAPGFGLAEAAVAALYARLVLKTRSVTVVMLTAGDADPGVLEAQLAPLRALLHAPSPPIALATWGKETIDKVFGAGAPTYANVLGKLHQGGAGAAPDGPPPAPRDSLVILVAAPGRKDATRVAEKLQETTCFSAGGGLLMLTPDSADSGNPPSDGNADSGELRHILTSLSRGGPVPS